MYNRCLAKANFVKDIDDIFTSLSGVTHSPDLGKLLRSQLTSNTKHMEY